MEGNDGYVVPLASFVDDERNTDVLRPYGVFAVIAPFNFPAALSVGMAAAALIAGNTVVLQALRGDAVDRARSSPRSSRAAELPPGVFNLVHGGRGHRPRAGRRARSTASPSPARPRSAARSPARCRTAPTPGPPSPRWAARTRRSSPPTPTSTRRPRAWRAPPSASSGQKCSACSRAIVVDDVHDEFVERLVRVDRAPAARRPGRSRELRRARWSTRPRVARFEDAVADGARATAGRRRRRASRRGPGHFVEPTVVSRPARSAIGSSATSSSCPSSP